MHVVLLKLLAIWFVLCFPLSSCIEPISSSLGAISLAALASSFYFGSLIKWPWEERCGQKWKVFDVNGLDLNLRKHLFGQHLVTHFVSNSIKAHILKERPKKALVLAFHGWTGGGKNYAAKIIADSLYAKGSKSSFVHWYIATRDFPHAGEVKKYREKLLKEISEYTKTCERSLFIFDEVDKISPGVLDALKPYLDFYEDIDGVDYRKNIYIFLSNAGGSEITRIALNFWLEGKDREDIVMKDIEPLINQGAFNEKGGFQHSEIIERNLIDVYVPFLPLEKKHIRKCISYELESRGLKTDNDVIEKVNNEMMYYPPEFQLYSVSGCKKVSHKIDLFGSDKY